MNYNSGIMKYVSTALSALGLAATTSCAGRQEGFALQPALAERVAEDTAYQKPLHCATPEEAKAELKLGSINVARLGMRQIDGVTYFFDNAGPLSLMREIAGVRIGTGSLEEVKDDSGKVTGYALRNTYSGDEDNGASLDYVVRTADSEGDNNCVVTQAEVWGNATLRNEVIDKFLIQRAQAKK